MVLPGVGEARLSIDARVDELRRASSWLCHCAQGFATPRHEIDRLELCLNEALANILTYGTDAALMQPIEIHLIVKGDERAGEASLRICDSGMAFNPADFVPKPAALSLAHAEIGGLGVQLIRHNTDSMDYMRSEGRNVLKLGFTWPQTGDGRR